MALKQILLLRHAEKPADPEDPTLAPEGAERARRLAQMLPTRYGTIDAVYATAASKHSNRPILTAQPLADALQLRVIDDVADQDYAVLAERLLSLQKHDGKRVVICWHHGHIPDFAAALGVANPPAPWPPLVFDRVWVIKPDIGGAKLNNEPQNLMPGDSQA
jgi:phosphohistidine phosphatase SixA